MKIKNLLQIRPCAFAFGALALSLAGCATTSTQNENTSSANTPAVAGKFATHYRASDGRDISIGKSVAADNGWNFKEPHMDKCWIADGFTFNGYDVVYIAPTLSTAKFHDDETTPHELAKQNLPIELGRELSSRAVFPKVVTVESEIPPGAHVLKVENTIIEYKKGGGAARYWVGLYGGGQPVLRVQGQMTDGDKAVFTYEARRSGVSGGARMMGAFMKDEDIQLEDIRSMTLDLGDFVSAVAGKYPPIQ
jgi:hypothetical protein